jgi:hypothetical protein
MAVPLSAAGAAKILSGIAKILYFSKKNRPPSAVGAATGATPHTAKTQPSQKTSTTRGALCGFAKAGERSRPPWQNRVT